MRGTRGKDTMILFYILTLLAVAPPGCSTRFEVKPDGTDLITYRFGGGEVGADSTEIRIRGDGTVTYIYRYPASRGDMVHRTITLSSGETKRLMQDLVDAGLMDLKSDRLGGADLDWAEISARIDGRSVDALFAGSFEGLKQVRTSIFPLMKQIHPELWGQP